MKKLLIKLTAVILSLTICLGFVGCSNTQDPPKTAKVAQLIETAITNILNEEHVNLAITAGQINDGEEETYTSTINANLYLKNKNGLYDVIANSKVSNKIQYKSSTMPDDINNQESGFYMIGNEMVNWQKNGDEIVELFEEVKNSVANVANEMRAGRIDTHDTLCGSVRVSLELHHLTSRRVCALHNGSIDG